MMKSNFSNLDKKTRTLFILLIFNAISAIGGGLALMTGTMDMPEWVLKTDFLSICTPGMILFAVVGGSAIIAALALYKRAIGWQIASIVSGVIMLLWIIGEIASIRTFHWLQIIYFITAGLILWLTPTTIEKAKK